MISGGYPMQLQAPAGCAPMTRMAKPSARAENIRVFMIPFLSSKRVLKENVSILSEPAANVCWKEMLDGFKGGDDCNRLKEVLPRFRLSPWPPWRWVAHRRARLPRKNPHHLSPPRRLHHSLRPLPL